MSDNKLSIVICTYNRYVLLEKNLRHLRELGYVSRHEIIVVDNSSDQASMKLFTEQVLPQFPEIRYVLSSPPGLSLARNKGLDLATGDICAFIDDDAFPEPGWDTAMIGVFNDENVAFAGGRIELLWETGRPGWLPAEYESAFTAHDYGPKSRPLGEYEYAVGANMAFRTVLARQNGGFDPSLGRKGDNLLSDEETAFCAKLLKDGKVGFYVADALVKHFVPKERISKEWLVRRMAWQGFSEHVRTQTEALDWKLQGCKEFKNVALKSALFELLREPETQEEMAEHLLAVRALGDILFRKWPERFTSPVLPLLASGQSFVGTRSDALAAAVLDEAEVLMVEFTTHACLYNAFGSARTAPYLVTNFDAWGDHERLLAETRKALQICRQRGIGALFFITVSPFFALSDSQLEVFKDCGVRLFGILHSDIPTDSDGCRAATTLSGYFEKLFVFHDECRQELMHLPFAQEVGVIPHPPSLLGSFMSRAPGVREIQQNSKVTLGFLGELREGKGFLPTTRLLVHLPLHIKTSIKCIYAGGSRLPDEMDEIKTLLATSEIEADFMLKGVGASYRVLTDVEFADAIMRSDIIAFPYHDKAAQAFSGAFLDGLMCGSVFIATNDSAMGRILKRHGLGFTFSLDSVASLEDALQRSMEAVRMNALHGAQRSFLQSYFSVKMEDLVLEAVRR